VSDLEELQASRARLTANAAEQLRSIERALHDGVQQDLIAISVQLQLVRELVAREQPEALEVLQELLRQAADALDRVRALAAEIYPSLLDARGLGDALREAARGIGVRARIDAEGLRRLPREVEAAAYFCCRAILQGVAPGTAVTIDLREHGGALRLDLTGGDEAGSVAARDVVEAAGGAVTVEPARGGGRLRATIPLP
jgi:signal transduction histidine kinase